MIDVDTIMMRGMQQAASLGLSGYLSSVSSRAFPRLCSLRPARRRILRVKTSARKGQPSFQVHVQPAPPAQNPLMASPWYIKGPLVLVILSLSARLLKGLVRGNPGCVAASFSVA